jgi:hypothetical protein
MEVIDPDNTIVSLAHPWYTFPSIDVFRAHISRLIDRGVNAIELTSTGEQAWTESILSVSEDRMDSMSDPIIYTHGSDCHDLYPAKDDTHHGVLWDMSPYVSDFQRHSSREDILYRIGGADYRRRYHEHIALLQRYEPMY